MVQAASPWCKYSAVLPEIDEYTIHDYECREFTALVTVNTHQQSLYTQMTTLFALLDRLWNSGLARYTLTQVTRCCCCCHGDDDDDANRVATLIFITIFGTWQECPKIIWQ